MKPTRLFLLLTLSLVIFATTCKEDSDDETTTTALLAALALAGANTGDNPTCGVVNFGAPIADVPAIGATGAVRPVQFKSGVQFIGVALLLNAAVGAEYVVTYPNGAAGGQSAYNDFTCPIDQGPTNNDTVPGSKLTTGAQGATSQTFTVNEAGNYSIVFTYLADPGTTITIQKTK